MTNCPKCGNPLAEESNFCHKCGAPLRPHPPIVDALHDVFSSKLLTLAAIFFTVAVLTELFFNDEILLFEILSAIALWMTVAANRHDNIKGYKSPLEIFSTIAKIDTAIMWISSGVYTVSGLLLLIFGETCLKEIKMLFSHSKAAHVSFEVLYEVSSIAKCNYIMLLVIFLLIVGVSNGIITFFVYTKIHRCAESFLLSFKLKENRIEHITLTKVTILVLAILSLLGMTEAFLGHPAAYISSLCALGGEVTVFFLLNIFERRFEKYSKDAKTN